MSLSNADLGFVLGAPAAAPAPAAVAPPAAATVAQAPAPIDGGIIPLSTRIREAGKRAGIDTDKLGIDVSEFDYITGSSDLTIGPPPSPFADVVAGGSTSATITPAGAFAKPESFDSSKNNFLDSIFDPALTLPQKVGMATIELGKGLVEDVVDGVSGYGDLWSNTFEDIGIQKEMGQIMAAIEADPNDLAARAALRSLRDRSDALDKENEQNLWDIATAGAMFVGFGSGAAIKLGAKGAAMFGGKKLAASMLTKLAERGVAATATTARVGAPMGATVRLADRAMRGAAMGGTYGFFSSEGDLKRSAESAAMMGTLFGVGPPIAAPFKAAFNWGGKQGGRAINAFGQIPAVASVRKSIYDGPIGRNWDYLATRSEKVFEDFKLIPLLTNMHVARIEGTRLAGKWVAGMQTNLKAQTPEIHGQVAMLMERGITPAALAQQLGPEKAAPIIRAAATESRRLKQVGRMLQAWGIPMHNSATGDLYNFVMLKNYMPHIIVNPEKLLTDPKLRAQSIKAIAAKTGKSLDEAEADFLQWAERAKFDAASEASSGAIGRATMEARLYGLPGYSLDLPNVLNLYYQKAAKLLAFHRRLGRNAPSPNAWGGGDDAAAIAGAGPDVPVGGAPEIVPPANAKPGAIASGTKVIVAGKNGPMKGVVVNPAANNKDQVRVRVGKRLLTVSGSKVSPEPVKPARLKKAKAEAEAPKKREPRTALPKMAAAAVQLSDGTIETGAFHGEIYERIGDRVGENPIDGFVDAAGKFYNRKQAALGDLPKSEMRKELGRLGYTAKEIGAIIKGMKDEAVPEPQAPPDPTVEVPEPPRRAPKPKAKADKVPEGWEKAYDRLPADLQKDVSAYMYRGSTFKEAVVLARTAKRRASATTAKDITVGKYKAPTNERAFRKDAVAKNEGDDLVRNEKMRGVNLSVEEEAALNAMVEAGLTKQEALDIMFKAGKRKAEQKRPTTRNTVKRELKKKDKDAS